jgi:hypothetical protein
MSVFGTNYTERVSVARDTVIYLSQMEGPNGVSEWEDFLGGCLVGSEDMAALWVAFPYGRARSVSNNFDYALYGSGDFARRGAKCLGRHYGRGLSELAGVYDALLDLGIGDGYSGLFALVEGIDVRRGHVESMGIRAKGLSMVAELADKYRGDQYALAMLSTFSVQEARLGVVTSEAELRTRYDRVEKCVATMVHESCTGAGGV